MTSQPPFFDLSKSKDTNEAHYKSDVDVSTRALHHTLGPKANQAAAGNHSHWEPWKTLGAVGFTLTNVTDYGDPFSPVMVTRSLGGDFVLFRGALKFTTAVAASTPFLTAPTGWRPVIQQILVAHTNAASGNRIARLDLAQNGTIFMDIAAANGDVISLSNVQYSCRL